MPANATNQNKKIGAVQKKILSCILAGVAIGLSRSPRKQWKILTKELPEEFAKINMQSAEYGLHRLYKDCYIKFYKKDGEVYFPYLTKEGKVIARQYDLENLKISIPNRWDGQWRLVMFDIPEKFKKKRDALRFHIRRLGFKEINKSVFAFPYEAGREIMEVVEFYHLRKFVCYAVTSEISKDLELKIAFGL